ncbi:YdeI/OmpD-associated family protein [Patescibacteria group bacterium]|nr:YdeI/OmpD-associated family protein [Patescibacteria group bacterium]
MDSVYIKNIPALRAWLKKNHTRKSGCWLVYDKGEKRSMHMSVVIDELLSYGWVDSKVGKVDHERSRVWIAPRNPKSNWSKVNKTKIARLMKEKRMKPAGLRMVTLAKKTGTWDALNAVEALEVPSDLKKTLKTHAPASAHFDAFPRSVKRAILEWILNAKKPETRAKRIEETAKLAAKNIRANQYRQK